VNSAIRGINAIGIQISLEAAPEISVPALSLSARAPIDSATIAVLVAFAVTGLAATVAIYVTGGDPSRLPPTRFAIKTSPPHPSRC